MRYAGLEKYKNATVIAGDVGFIGYFTGAQVCARNNPGLLFLTTSQLSGIAPFLDVKQFHSR